MKIFFRKFVNVSILRIFPIPLDLLISIILAKNLNPNNYGIFITVFIIPNIIASLGSLGMGAAIVFHMAKEKLSVTKLFTTFYLHPPLFQGGEGDGERKKRGPVAHPTRLSCVKIRIGIVRNV